MKHMNILQVGAKMIIAKFVTGPDTEKLPYQVQISFLEYVLAKIDTQYFLKRLGKKYNKNFVTMYYGGVEICK